MAVLTGPTMVVVGNTASVHDSALNTLGQRAFDIAGNEYIYLQGVASTVANDAVTYDELYATARSVAAAVGPVAIAQAAVVAAKFGWYLICGRGTVNVAAAVADNAKLFLTATAGNLDDASVAGDQVVGAYARSAAGGAGSVTVQVVYPIVGVNVA